jgi:hypothetical protein
MWMKSESDALRSSPGAPHALALQGQATEGRMFASVAPREVVARLRRGVVKPQVKPLIGVSDPYTLAWPSWNIAREDARAALASIDDVDARVYQVEDCGLRGE